MKILSPYRVYNFPLKIRGRELRRKAHPELYLFYETHRQIFERFSKVLKNSYSMNGVICHRKGRLK